MTDTSVHSLAVSPPAASPAAGPAAPAADGRFGGLLRTVQHGVWEVKSGDTLIGIVKRHYAAQGQSVSETQAYRLAHQLAREQGIADADRIVPGQRIALDRLPAQAQAQRAPVLDESSADALQLRAAPVTAAQALGASQALRPADAPVAARAPLRSYQSGDAQDHPVLERTLQRAVQKGFVPPHEVQAVHRRIVDMADKYGFAPDDFAKVSLMESDGLNPKATNGSCHGIIQFCGGAGRGADSVGFGRNAREILGLSVMQQLDLVERYFNDVGLNGRSGPLKLDDLYLSVLMPSARREKQAHVPLDIAGQQAAKLYVGGNRAGAITRQSIVQGLVQHAMARLGMDSPAPTKVARAPEPPLGTP
jgi:hypothetical protein